MAARRRGLTPGPGPWWDVVVVVVVDDDEGGWCWGCGVFAPVATGVVMLDGSSEVKIVALDGEMRYREFRVATKASLKPNASISLAKR